MSRFRHRAAVTDLCKWAEVNKSSFHYQAHPGKRGMKASTHTPESNAIVPNGDVVEKIRSVLVLVPLTTNLNFMLSSNRQWGVTRNPELVNF
jgi:hypothetical protein